jgi:hypothetical protein
LNFEDVYTSVGARAGRGFLFDRWRAESMSYGNGAIDEN